MEQIMLQTFHAWQNSVFLSQLLVSVPFVLTYFIDAEETEEPISLKNQTWASVKKFIQEKVSDYLR